jgi:predicted hydrocarbon binding protein
MLPFVTKLLFSKQLSFEAGKFTIFGHRVMIFPVDLLLVLNKRCDKDKELRKMLYTAMKEAVYGFAMDIDKSQNISKGDMAGFLTNLTEMNGYGKIKIPKLDFDRKVAIFQMFGLPSERQVGKIKHNPIDYYWAGMLAGGASFVFKDKSIECVEIKCVVSGKSPYCEFVAGKKEYVRKFRKSLFS